MERSYLFLNERISPVDMEIHALSRGLLLLESIGIKTGDVSYKLPVSSQDRAVAKGLLSFRETKPVGPLVAVHPIAKWDTKLWDSIKFSLVVDRLIEDCGAQVFFTGSEKDRPGIEALVSDMSNRAENLAGMTNLKTLAALYEVSDCLVTTDTGPMHLAAAVGTPVVALFGPTAPWRTGPFGSGHQILSAGLDCSPCFKRRCEDVACMRLITVEKVVCSVRKVLGLAYHE